MSIRLAVAMAALGLLFRLVPLELGPVYENKEYGFAIKPLKDWGAVPPKPDEKYKIVSWISKHEQLGRKERIKFSPELRVLVFRTDAKSDLTEEQQKHMSQEQIDYFTPPRSYGEYVEKRHGDNFKKVGDPKKLKFGEVPVTIWTHLYSAGNQPPLRTVAYVFSGKDVEVAVELESMDEWYDSLAKDFEACTHSFKFVERPAGAAAPKPADPPASPPNGEKLAPGTTIAPESPEVVQKRFLDEQIAKLPPGWKHFASKKNRYLVLYDAEDEFVKKLAQHLEAMRDYYETIFPPTKKITAVSIVRVCKNEDTYLGYGAPPGTGGYWSDRDHELVVYQNKAIDQLGTFGVVGHEAFHQYIFYFYGKLDPASWYNEGHGDYFSGAVMSGSGEKVLEIKPFKRAGYDREDTIKEAVRANTWTPFKKFFAYTQREYYQGSTVHVNYAQGWSIVYFLRNGRKAGAKLEQKWVDVLDQYMKNLVAARDEIVGANQGHAPYDLDDDAQKRAYRETFKSWNDEDWSAFEAAWKHFFGGN